ncbi:hypothetical protein PRIPAC_77432, partial [Pristionchus pacificus]|uniref:G protein-coupled receptor n=1 Tax=Pristionchus pacificus TaxID=54126 RepID=A0A2A6CLI4_PRIPA
CGVLFNLVLIILINKYSRSKLGTYKYLLYIFAIYDFSSILTAFFCASFTVPFALVIINFLYRYWAVQQPHRIRLYSNILFCFVLAFVCFLGAAAWYCAVFLGCTGQEESLAKTTARFAYRRQYGEIIMEGYVLMEHWKDDQFNIRPALVLLYFDTLNNYRLLDSLPNSALYSKSRANGMVHSRSTRPAAYCALRTDCSTRALSVYSLLFRALFSVLWHFCIPTNRFHDHFNSCFPPVVAVVIIALMADYRNGLASAFLKVIRRGDERQSTTSVATSQSISLSTAL